ncbi:hypothetical protein [Sphaerisporangium perillae]|uniref:hypothetical protein n=1 Tax=Sphaerisporangium perillae TaxID=2935860 RepID=UPI00200BDE81|nr:hypothetical protein [Sphaerisporangium perillae]
MDTGRGSRGRFAGRDRETSLALLRQVAAEAANSRLLVVATHRDPAPGRSGFARTLAEIVRSRGARTIALVPLTVADVRRILEAVPGDTADTETLRAAVRGSARWWATRLPAARWYHLRVVAARAALSGRFDEARSRSSAAGELAVRMGDSLACMVTDVFAELLALVRGDRREMPDGYRDSFARLPRIPIVEAAHALCLHLDRGE